MSEVRIEYANPKRLPVKRAVLVSLFRNELSVEADALSRPRFRWTECARSPMGLNHVDPVFGWGDVKEWAQALVKMAEEHGA